MHIQLLIVFVQGFLELTLPVLSEIITNVSQEVLNFLASATVYFNDPLCNGEGYNTGNNCCAQAGMLWFYRDVINNIDEH